MKQVPIEFHIEALRLHNLPYQQRHQIAAAVERALARIIDQQGLPSSLAQGGYIPCLNIDQLPLATGADAEAISEQIAQAIYHHLVVGTKSLP